MSWFSLARVLIVTAVAYAAALLRPLPFSALERLVTIWEADPARGIGRQLTSPANFLDWQRHSTAFESMAMAEPFGHTLIGEGEPETFRSWAVSAGFFDVLGSAPLLGRTFASEDHDTGSAPVVVLSHRAWARRFGKDPGVVGRTVNANDFRLPAADPAPTRVASSTRRPGWNLRTYPSRVASQSCVGSRRGALSFGSSGRQPSGTVRQRRSPK